MDNIMKQNFRGFINSKTNSYYILNEVVSGDIAKSFSAIKIDEMRKDKINSQKFLIKFFSKKYITECILSKNNLTKEKINTFYATIKKKFESYAKIIHPNIQELKDYIEDEHGIYIVYEFCQYSLSDYLTNLRELTKHTRYPFECKVRKLIVQILETIYYIQGENLSLNLGGMINSNDIMVSEIFNAYNEKSSNTIVVKFPHPFLLDVVTIVNLLSYEKFPSNYAPELYNLFFSENNDTLDLNNLNTNINLLSDMWSLGYLLYEILFEEAPFEFENVSSAISSLKQDFTYNIFPKKISKVMLELITRCLQLDPHHRLKIDHLCEIKNEIRNQNENLDDVERYLKERNADKRESDEIKIFNLVGYNDYEKF